MIAAVIALAHGQTVVHLCSKAEAADTDISLMESQAQHSSIELCLPAVEAGRGSDGDCAALPKSWDPHPVPTQATHLDSPGSWISDRTSQECMDYQAGEVEVGEEEDQFVLQLDDAQAQRVAIRAARGRTGSNGHTWSVMAVMRNVRYST